MPTTALEIQGHGLPPAPHLAFELGAKEGKLGFTKGLGRGPRVRAIGARDLAALQEGVQAREAAAGSGR